MYLISLLVSELGPEALIIISTRLIIQHQAHGLNHATNLSARTGTVSSSR